ncbi:MAG: TRAM domain-containing protein [Parachlamydiaceae bacterium]|nr:TRAM domain-containing protein [Parachlamydiaceae bacterium]
MNISFPLIQLLFTLTSILFSISFSSTYFEGGLNWINIGLGFLGGVFLAGLLIGSGFILKKLDLRSFCTVLLGLFLGYLMAEAILFTISGILHVDVYTPQYMPLRFFSFLIFSYFGIFAAVRTIFEIISSFPFLPEKQPENKKKDILVDISILNDPRIIDLASTGLLDHQLIIPRFALKDLYTQTESSDEFTQSKARRSLEVIKQLETLSTLDLRYADNDFTEITDTPSKLIHLARHLDTHIITSDIHRIQQPIVDGIRFINIHMLSNALKPITQAGATISIKIQRYGKEARQGVGYLDDGTMVVVNGGAEFIGKTIKAHVLSVKHTSSGRMIFCNAAEDNCILDNCDLNDEESMHSMDLDDNKSYVHF